MVLNGQQIAGGPCWAPSERVERETLNIRNKETSKVESEPMRGFALERCQLHREGKAGSEGLSLHHSVSRMFPTLGSGLSQRGTLGPLSEYKGEEGDGTPDRNGKRRKPQ